jgi:hypothetical protein
MNDMETCSWCTTEVLDSTLVEIEDGARICGECADMHETTDEMYCKTCNGWSAVTRSDTFTGFAGGASWFAELSCGHTVVDESNDMAAAR